MAVPTKTPRPTRIPMAKKSARKKAGKSVRKPARKAARKSARPASATRRTAKKAGRAPELGLKRHLIESWGREHERTLRVLRAFPPDQGDFRPHPRSTSARDLAFTFVLEQSLLMRALLDDLKIGGGQMPRPPATIREVIEKFDADFHDLVEQLRATPEQELLNGKTQFFTGPRQLGEYTKLDFAWFLLMDQIHHRGQYTVYVRMAGGAVPSVYGPSADEPWT